MLPREPLHDFIIRRYSSGYWALVNQTQWADSHHGWLRAIVLANTEEYSRCVLVAENFICMGSSEFVNFYAGDIKLGTLVHLGKAFKMSYK